MERAFRFCRCGSLVVRPISIGALSAAFGGRGRRRPGGLYEVAWSPGVRWNPTLLPRKTSRLWEPGFGTG